MKTLNHLKILKAAYVFLFACIAVQVNAQTVGTDAFLQGDFIEVGISDCGVFASGSPPLTPGPIGPYHPTEPQLGFVADSDMDGWAVGVPNYCGDYFVPGSPVEGWALQFGTGATYTNTDQYCSPYDIPGDITGYEDFGSRRAAEWTGTLVTPSGIDICITQETSMPVDKRYFVTNVTIRNNGVADIIDLYYLRNVDPDNEQPATGDYTTTNTIISQPPMDPEALVTAEGLIHGCFLGIGAQDSMARVTYGGFNTGSPYEVWNGIGVYSLAGTNTADEAISIAFKIPLLPAGEQTTIAFAHVLDPLDLDEALEATSGLAILADSVDITDSAFAVVCPNDSMLLEIIGTGTNSWLWTPDTLLSADTGSAVYVYPSASDTITYTVMDTSSDCNVLEITINVITDISVAAVDAGIDLSVCLGDSIQLNGSSSSTDFYWSPGGTLSDSALLDPYATPTTATDYILYAFTPVGCANSDTMSVSIGSPSITAGPDKFICEGASVMLEGAGGVAYSWLPTTDLDDPLIATPLTTTPVDITYAVTIIDSAGCEGVDSVNVFVTPSPTVDAGADQTIDLVLGEMAMLNALSPTGVSYTWAPPTGLSNANIANPIAQPGDTTIYIVTVADANGCLGYDTVTVFVLNELAIVLPNAFTPDGNGLNDQVGPSIIGLIDFIDYSIYNRWGERIFYTEQLDVKWDGTYQGKPQEMGTYIAVIRMNNFEGKEIQHTAPITLIR